MAAERVGAAKRTASSVPSDAMSCSRCGWSWRRPSTTARSGWRCRGRWRSTRRTLAHGHSSTGDAASQPGGAAGRTGAGAAGHHGAGCRLRAGGPAARCSCAADGGQVGGCAEDRRPLRPQVSKISSPSCPPPRQVLPVPQTAEQLVDVPVPSVREVTIFAPAARGP